MGSSWGGFGNASTTGSPTSDRPRCSELPQPRRRGSGSRALPDCRLREKTEVAPVLIGAGEVKKEVCESAESHFFKRLGADVADALQLTDAFAQHGASLLSFILPLFYTTRALFASPAAAFAV